MYLLCCKNCIVDVPSRDTYAEFIICTTNFSLSATAFYLHLEESAGSAGALSAQDYRLLRSPARPLLSHARIAGDDGLVGEFQTWSLHYASN